MEFPHSHRATPLIHKQPFQDQFYTTKDFKEIEDFLRTKLQNPYHGNIVVLQ